MKFTNKQYDVLKSFALIYIPALATLYWGLSLVWGLPDAHQVIATLTVIDTFLGAVLKISTSMNTTAVQGVITVDKTRPGKPPQYSFNITEDLEKIESMLLAHFRVQHVKGSISTDGQGGGTVNTPQPPVKPS